MPRNTQVLTPTGNARIQIRPLRLGFAVDPQDTSVLRDVLRINSVFWGGIYNFIIPVLKKSPPRYREQFLKGPSANDLMNGLTDAFQPDFLVETKAGLGSQIRFSRERILSLEQLQSRDEMGHTKYGVDMRTICAALYDEAFRFVQRHQPKVVIPQCSDSQFSLLFAAMFGEFPTTGNLADCLEHYKAALDGKDESVAPVEFPRLFGSAYLFPLRVGNHQLSTRHSGWTPDPMLFYMDERSNFDLIEFWNLRAIGWRIRPLPASIADKMKGDCEEFVREAHRPFPPPSNAFQNAAFLCSRSCNWDQMQAFVSTLKRPTGHMVTVDPRVPRLWEEWGRNADHAEPQQVSHETKSVDVVTSFDSLHLRTAIPDFVESGPFTAPEYACANVLESAPGGAAVVPWQNVNLDGLIRRFGDTRVWLGREGILTTAGEFSFSRFLRSPSPLNVFRAFAEGQGFAFSVSPSGQVCQQIVAALGGLEWVRLIANESILRLFDDLARGDFQIEIDDEQTNKKRRVRSGSAPYGRVQKILMQASDGDKEVAANLLNTLVRRSILKLGIRLKCTECQQKSWYSLEELSSSLKCPRCLQVFSFFVDRPPRDEWAYRVLGPFAVENFASGSYCVAATLRFLAEEIGAASTWVPSFEMSQGETNCEADFGMFLRPNRFSNLQGPFLIFGECKTFGDFEDNDFSRARKLANLFPGAILCFATLKEMLSIRERREISKIARRGRASLKTGQQTNPVLVLTRLELFGQFRIAAFSESYGDRAQYASHVFMRRDIEEVCDFTQQVHLGMESLHFWRQAKRKKRAQRASKLQIPRRKKGAV